MDFSAVIFSSLHTSSYAAHISVHGHIFGKDVLFVFYSIFSKRPYAISTVFASVTDVKVLSEINSNVWFVLNCFLFGCTTHIQQKNKTKITFCDCVAYFPISCIEKGKKMCEVILLMYNSVKIYVIPTGNFFCLNPFSAL